jgi:hypothetical protein
MVCLLAAGDSASNAAMALSSVFAARSHIKFSLISSLSLLPDDAFDGLLSGKLFAVDSEEALLRILLTFPHPPFL